MILKGSQRSGGMQLALHLLKTEDNEHVEIHELKGFVADDLIGAFKEAHAISTGTKCRQFLFSLSLSPPERESVPVEVFEKAIADIESKMGLTDQPRAIVFHEKEGRRHAHCVWSRIDVEQMKAINLPHFKLKLRDVSRQLYLQHNWKMPRGLMNSKERNPLNFTQAEWQQAKRAKQDPRILKEMFQDCWAVSDSVSAFANALKERGFYLAKGDRRGHVAVDWRGEVYAISRWVGVKAKEVRARLGKPDDLPSVADTQEMITERFTDKLRDFSVSAETQQDRRNDVLAQRRQKLVSAHRLARENLRANQAERLVAETKGRASNLPTGLKALWFRVTGKYRKLRLANENEAQENAIRDRQERQKMIEIQLRERRALQHEFLQLRHHHEITMKKLGRDMGAYLELSGEGQNEALQRQRQKSIKQVRNLRR